MTNNPTTYYEYPGNRFLSRITQQMNDLYLTHCGIQSCPPLHSWGPGTRDEYHIHFILDGEGYLEIGTRKYHLKRGQIFLLPANVPVYYCADKENPWYYAWAGFNGSKAESYLSQAGFSEGCFIRDTVVPPEHYSTIIHEMLEANKLTAANELIRIGCLYHLISLLIDTNAETSASKHTQYDYSIETYVEHAIQYIQFNYNTDIKINDLVNYIGINRSYLSYIFKKKLQMSPKKYLIKFRIEKAKELLASDSTPIKEVAYNVGYTDPLAFSKMFHQVTGISPSAYREAHLGATP